MRARAPTLLVAVLIAGCGVDAMVEDPPASFSFSVMGDAPYHAWEENQFDRVLAQINDADLAFAISVGDVLWRPCSDAMMRDRLGRFATLRYPLIYTPGDNEWTDCHLERVGGFVPLDRLQSVRTIFFGDPRHSLGQAKLPLQTQADREPWTQFVENVRWVHEGVTFATVHMVGSANGTEPFDGRGAADDEAAARRKAAAIAWLHETFEQARTESARAIVIATHADMDYRGENSDYRTHYEPFVTTLASETAAFDGVVLLVHGDSHEYLVDQPLRDPSGGEVLGNFTRLQVMGSPYVGWVRVVVPPGPQPRFAFEPHVIPRWMFW